MFLYLMVAFGGALGSVSRFALSGWVAQRYGDTFPWGTLVVNVAGCFAIGVIAALTAPDGRMLIGSTSRQFFMTGVLGGFTTFSSFSLQTLTLVREGDWLRAGGNTVGSVVLCLVSVWLGHVVALWLNSLKGS